MWDEAMRAEDMMALVRRYGEALMRASRAMAEGEPDVALRARRAAEADYRRIEAWARRLEGAASRAAAQAAEG